jgi:hypothetical protein
MIVLLAAAFVGGLLGFTVLWPYGAVTALLGAQLGASSLAFLICPVLALRRASVERKQCAGIKLASRAWTRAGPIPGSYQREHVRKQCSRSSTG